MKVAEDMNPTLKHRTAFKKKDLTRALQTYFRNSYRTHISLSALADRKSNIMVRLNSLLIGLLIVFFKGIVSYNHATVLTGVIFLLTALASLVFAALAARPHITSVLSAGSSIDEAKRNLFFFGNFVKLDMEKYTASFESLLEEPDLTYENMIRDLYFLGKVLDKKFRLLKFSYLIFIWGLVLTVISFLFAVLL